MTDSELCTNVRVQLKALCTAINAALDAGLDVNCTLDATDKYYPAASPNGAVRERQVRITRTF